MIVIKRKAFLTIVLVIMLITYAGIFFTIFPFQRIYINFHQIRDFIATGENQSQVCTKFYNDKQSLINIGFTFSLNREFPTINEAIQNYSWETQYLPVADIYCYIPLNIRNVVVLNETLIERNNTFKVKVNIEGDLDSVFYTVVTLEKSPNGYRLVSVERYSP